MTNLLTLSKASKILGVTTRTLREWDYLGKIKTTRTLGGHRRIPIEEINRLQGNIISSNDEITICYCRCSTLKQTENLERQVGRVLEYCANKNWKVELYKEIGSGINDNRKEFKKIIKRLQDEKVKRIVVEYPDRLTRFGFSTFVEYCKNFNVETIILEETNIKTFEEEMTNDIISLITSYSARLYGRCGGKNK